NSAGGIGVFHQIREVFFRPSLGISTQLEYVARYKEDSRLPSDPVRFYDECKSWRHFFQEDYEKAYPTYEEAKSAARRLGVHTAKEYKNRYLADKKLRSESPLLS
ncbi:integrase repeat-containing protein, partial [Pseudomonas putida]|uniref:integrase repeat-containing protein n=1 Tax=Pseudomonas putida TaxID=303 RepID=UPI0011AF5577